MRIFVAYVPVVHRGLLRLLREENLPVFVLGEDFIAEYPQLTYDLRAVKPEEAVEMLCALGFSAGLLNKRNLSNLTKGSFDFVLPTDEVMTIFAERWLTNLAVEYRQVFIRHDKINTTSEKSVEPDQLTTVDEFARQVMIRCHERAKLSSDWWRQVGAAAVRGDQVLVYGVNRAQPTDYSPEIDGDIRQCFGFGERVEICGTIHAEASVIAQAAKQGLVLAGTDFYCTTFPCPMCARLLVASGIARLIYQTGYSVCDAHEILKAGQVEVVRLLT